MHVCKLHTGSASLLGSLENSLGVLQGRKETSLQEIFYFFFKVSLQNEWKCYKKSLMLQINKRINIKSLASCPVRSRPARPCCSHHCGRLLLCAHLGRSAHPVRCVDWLHGSAERTPLTPAERRENLQHEA